MANFLERLRTTLGPCGKQPPSSPVTVMIEITKGTLLLAARQLTGWNRSCLGDFFHRCSSSKSQRFLQDGSPCNLL